MSDVGTDTNTSAAPEAGAAPASSAVALPGLGGIVGVKAGMTQVYNENGDFIAVTVIDLRPNLVTQVKTKSKEGYNSVQVSLDEKPAKKTTKALQGHFKKVGKEGFYLSKEIRLPDDAKMETFAQGALLSPEFIKIGDLVDVTSMSKGKGHQGVMKRWNFGGLPRSHGMSVCHRAPGSIGNRADPAKVFRGKKMGGHMGHEKTTIQNIAVAGLDLEKGVLLVHGSVPGPKSGYVTIRRAVKHSA